jgi:hypothetical protein
MVSTARELRQAVDHRRGEEHRLVELVDDILYLQPAMTGREHVLRPWLR